jgi:Oligosaccharyltransferase subunit Ribophorin II
MQTHKDLPSQFLRSSSSLSASIVIGSFGSSNGYNARAFSLAVEIDTNQPVVQTEKPLRYGKLPEIHHIFRSDPKSPNIVIVLVFTGAVITTLPILLCAVSPPRCPRLGHVTLTVCTVALSRRQPQSSLPSNVRRPRLACPIRWLDRGHRIHLFSVLHGLESLPNPTRTRGRRSRSVPERQPRLDRSSRAETGWFEMRSSSCCTNRMDLQSRSRRTKSPNSNQIIMSILLYFTPSPLVLCTSMISLAILLLRLMPSP